MNKLLNRGLSHALYVRGIFFKPMRRHGLFVKQFSHCWCPSLKLVQRMIADLYHIVYLKIFVCFPLIKYQFF